jgi:hypothetical protein
MKKVEKYINETLGLKVTIREAPSSDLASLNVAVKWTFTFFETDFFGQKVFLINPKDVNAQTVSFLALQTLNISKRLEHKVILVLDELEKYNRRRLIDKGVNFIVPTKQLFLPDFLVSLTDSFSSHKNKLKTEKLSPSAQFLVLYHLLLSRHNNQFLQQNSFKEIAAETGYSAMAITKAIGQLEFFDIVEIESRHKEKRLEFKLNGKELWQMLMTKQLLISPVYQTYYLPEINPEIIRIGTPCSETALSSYSDFNWQGIGHLAIEKNEFYALKKNQKLQGLNENEGELAIEIWYYSPRQLMGKKPVDWAVVDPLSLYLSLTHSEDERIQMALDKVINSMIW